MGINKDFYIPRREVEFNGSVACTIRGITPRDIAQIMQENANDLESVMESWQRDKTLNSVAGEGSLGDEIAAKLSENATVLFGNLIALVPDLAAKIIALASEEPEAWEHVRDNFVAPLQFDILCAVAELTFVNSDGFKKFVGNVLALAQNVGGSQRQITQ